MEDHYLYTINGIDDCYFTSLFPTFFHQFINIYDNCNRYIYNRDESINTFYNHYKKCREDINDSIYREDPLIPTYIDTSPKLISAKLKNSAYEIILNFDTICEDAYSTFSFNCSDMVEFNVNLTVNTCLWKNKTELSIFYKYEIAEKYIITVKSEMFCGCKNNILNVTDRDPVPNVLNAYFINDKSVIIKFDVNIKGIDKNGISCNEILNGTAFDKQSFCYLYSSDTIQMNLTKQSTLIPTSKENCDDLSTLYFINNMIKSYSNHLYGAKGYFCVRYPEIPPELIPIINGPTISSRCSEILLDGSNSYVSINIPIIYKWDCYDYNISGLERNNPFLLVPSNFLPLGSYVFVLSIKTFVHEYTTRITTVILVSTDSVVSISINGYKSITIKTDEDITIQGRISTQSCNSIIPIKYYLWYIKNVTNNEVVDSLKTSDPILNILPHFLKNGKYEITLTIDSDEYEGDSVFLTVELCDLKITTITPLIQIHGFNDPIVINVSQTIDLDNIDTLEYSWQYTKDNDAMTILPNTNNYLVFTETTAASYVFQVTVKGNVTGRIATQQFIIDALLKSNLLYIKADKNSCNPSDVITLYSNVNMGNVMWGYTLSFLTFPFIGSTKENLAYIDCGRLYPLESHNFYVVYDGIRTRCSIYVNKPPSLGYIMTSNIYYTFGDNIYITTSGWEGEKQFKYKFGVIIDEEIIYLHPNFILNNNYYGILPIGSLQYNYTLTLIVYVKDKNGGISNTTLDQNGNEIIIFSKPSEHNPLELLNNFTNIFKGQGEYYFIPSVILSVAKQINIRNCNNVKCMNNAICVNGYCQCPSGFKGKYCQYHKPINGGLSYNYYRGDTLTQCGTTRRKYYKKCDNPLPQYGGKYCDSDIKYVIEELPACLEIVDGGWSEWSEWSECDAYCYIYNGNPAYGVKHRSRTCTNPKPSQNGRLCEGLSDETITCFKVCESPYKLCPGEFILEDGSVDGIKCNNNGDCIIDNPGCKEYDPYCNSYCNCSSGFYGKECEYSNEEYINLLNGKKALVEILSELQIKMSTLEMIDQMFSSILSVLEIPASLPLNYQRAIIIDILSLILKLSLDDAVSYSYYQKMVKCLYLSGFTKNNEDKEDLYIYNHLYGHHNNNHYPSFWEVNIETFSFSTITLLSSFDPIVIFKCGDTLINFGSKENFRRLWRIIMSCDDSNEYKFTSTLIKIINFDTPKILDTPIYAKLKVGNLLNLKEIKCINYPYINEGFVVGLINYKNGSKNVICHISKFDSFSTIHNAVYPQKNVINYDNKVSLSVKRNNYNTTLIIVTVILFLLIIVLWIYYKFDDIKHYEDVSLRKFTSFQKYGYIKYYNDEDIKKENKHFIKKYWMFLLEKHSWISLFNTNKKYSTYYYKSENILSIAVQLFTSMAASAYYISKNGFKANDIICMSYKTSTIIIICIAILSLSYNWIYTYKSKKYIIKNSFFQKNDNTDDDYDDNIDFCSYKKYMVSFSLLFDILACIFFMTFIFIFPNSYTPLVLQLYYTLFLVETVSCLLLPESKYKGVVAILIFANFLILALIIYQMTCYILLLQNNSNTYWLWKEWATSSLPSEIIRFIEDNLNCCGYNKIGDYNVRNCNNNYALAYELDGCKIPLHNLMSKFSYFYISFNIIAILILIPKFFLFIKYFLSDIKIHPLSSEKTLFFSKERMARDKIVKILHYMVFKIKYKRKKEYIKYLRYRNEEMKLSFCMNIIIFIYLLLTSFIIINYGIKFSSIQIVRWLIITIISLLITSIILEVYFIYILAIYFNVCINISIYKKLIKL